MLRTNLNVEGVIAPEHHVLRERRSQSHRADREEISVDEAEVDRGFVREREPTYTLPCDGSA